MLTYCRHVAPVHLPPMGCRDRLHGHDRCPDHRSSPRAGSTRHRLRVARHCPAESRINTLQLQPGVLPVGGALGRHHVPEALHLLAREQHLQRHRTQPGESGHSGVGLQHSGQLRLRTRKGRDIVRGRPPHAPLAHRQCRQLLDAEHLERAEPIQRRGLLGQSCGIGARGRWRLPGHVATDQRDQ